MLKRRSGLSINNIEIIYIQIIFFLELFVNRLFVPVPSHLYRLFDHQLHAVRERRAEKWSFFRIGFSYLIRAFRLFNTGIVIRWGI